MPPASTSLFKSADLARWEDLRARHTDLQRHHGVASRDPAKLKKLAELDALVADELPTSVRTAAAAGGAPAQLLVRLVEWKLLRGKWRPALLGYARAQTDAAVADAMGKALADLGPSPSPPPPPAKARLALDALCALRGVGPATASIVLCAATGGGYPYMGDEALEAALGARSYTAEEYMALAAALQQKAAALRSSATKGGDGKRARLWTAEDVQRALHAAELEARAGAGAGGGGKAAAAGGAKGKAKKAPEAELAATAGGGKKGATRRSVTAGGGAKGRAEKQEAKNKAPAATATAAAATEAQQKPKRQRQR